MAQENREDTSLYGGNTDENPINENEENFATLFEKSGRLSGRLEPGQKIKTRVVGISGDLVYINLGGKSEGFIDLKEFKDAQGVYNVKAGDEIEAFFISVQNGLRKLTTLAHGLSTVNLSGIHDAYNANLPVSGKVRSEVKGGFEVHVGKARCFCPYSQIDLKRSRETEIYLGKTFPFKVLEYTEEGNNIILSRRVLLEEEQQIQYNRLKEHLEVGMVVTAKVRSIQSFGAFVDLDGIDGLIPMSEVAWGRTEKLEDVLSVGQEVTVKIIALDWEKNRITLSLKAIQSDPWMEAAEKYPVNSLVHGTIVRLAPFGAFVNLEPGIDGLIHISKLGTGRRIKHPKEVVEVDQWVEAYVQEVDPKNKKISLSMEQKLESENALLPIVGEIIEGVVEKVMPSGVLIKMNNSITGFIPNSEMGTLRGTNHNRMFPAGTAMQVVVIEVDAKRNRVVLSRSGVAERIEQEELTRYIDKVKKEETSSKSLGSLGELLKAKLPNPS